MMKIHSLKRVQKKRLEIVRCLEIARRHVLIKPISWKAVTQLTRNHYQTYSGKSHDNSIDDSMTIFIYKLM
jgi:hypothetical protein